MQLKQFLFWLPMIILAFANATLREMEFVKYFSEVRAHQLSTVTLIIVCSIYIWLVFPILNPQSLDQSLLIGIVWVLFTVAFEFCLGRLTNKSWQYLLRDYNLLAGRIWLLFLITLLFLPFVIYLLRNKG